MLDCLVVGERGELRVTLGDQQYPYCCTASFLGWHDAVHSVAGAEHNFAVARFFTDSRFMRDPAAFATCDECELEFQGEFLRAKICVDRTDAWGGGWCLSAYVPAANMAEPLLDRVLG